MTTMMTITMAKSVNSDDDDDNDHVHYDQDDDHDDDDAHHRVKRSTSLLAKQARYHILIWHRLMSGNVYWPDNS